jgi:hypothetical protein
MRVENISFTATDREARFYRKIKLAGARAAKLHKSLFFPKNPCITLEVKFLLINSCQMNFPTRKVSSNGCPVNGAQRHEG